MPKIANKFNGKYNLIKEMHNKLAYFLVTTFDTIFLPSFETSQMLTKLRSKTARMMQTFSHYQFRQHLQSKCEEYSSNLVICNEAYTSKTCSYCGKIHNIGSKNILKCDCGTYDRDENAARGILLRALAVSPL